MTERSEWREWKRDGVRGDQEEGVGWTYQHFKVVDGMLSSRVSQFIQ
jgi:hypothetical protein